MSKPQNKKNAARQVSLMGLLFALAAVLSFIEGLLPVLPMLPPGVKLGLSNIVTMYALFFLGTGSGVVIAVLKAFFVLLTRGPVAACLSAAGGLCSVAVMAFLLSFKNKPSTLLVSIFGAVFHNIGQLAASAVVLRSMFAMAYLPVMVLSGVVMGFVTAVLLKVLQPYLARLNHIVIHRNI
jgi:heptaprenyl diphosphate synthase